MAIRLVVRYRNPSHRLLVPTTVSVEGATEAAGSKPGERRFDVPDADGTTVTLRFVVPAPADFVSTRPLLDLTQRLEVAPGDGAPTLRPVGGPFEGGRADPRLLEGQPGARAGAGVPGQRGGLFTLEVDTTFLDVTDHARALADNDTPLSRVYSTDPTHEPNVLMLLLEHTGGQPALWKVFLPFALFANPFVKEVPALVFFRPTGDPYTDSRDAFGAFSRAMRYYLPPSTRDPFYGTDDADPDKRRWSMYPRCGWARQLHRSGRALMLVGPLPHATGYGVLEQSTNVRGYLDSIVRTLWSSRLVGEKRDAGVRVGRIAMAGYSFGGGQLLRCLDHNKDDVDEAYCFDPNDFPANVEKLATRFKHAPRVGPPRRLRMIGGFDHNHVPMIELAARLASPDLATVEPATRAVWFTDALYRAAATHPKHTELLDPVGTTPAPGSPSARTNLFVVPPAAGKAPDPDRTTIEARWVDPDGTPRSARAVMDGTVFEITGVVLFDKDQVTPDLLPVRSVAALTAITAAVKDELLDGHRKGRIPEMRHSWAVIGGVDTAGALGRGETFRGFFERILAASAFPG